MASLSDLPGARLKEIVLATKGPWWFTASGVLPGPKRLMADSGIIVSWLVLTAAADDAVPVPTFANELVAALRAELAAMVAAVVVLAVLVLTTVPPRRGRFCPRCRSARGADVDILQRLRALPVARRHFHDDVVLVLRAVDGGDLALSERIVKRVVDFAGVDPQAAGGCPIDQQIGFQPLLLIIRFTSRSTGLCSSAAEQFGRPFVEPPLRCRPAG